MQKATTTSAEGLITLSNVPVFSPACLSAS